MTITEKILCKYLSKDKIYKGERLDLGVLPKASFELPCDVGSVARGDARLGALQILSLENGELVLPDSVRVQLCSSCDEFDAEKFLSRLPDLSGKYVEFGGDSLSYLFLSERAYLAKRLCEKGCAFCLFECDYLTVGYAKEKEIGISPYFADGEWDYGALFEVGIS